MNLYYIALKTNVEVILMKNLPIALHLSMTIKFS